MKRILLYLLLSVSFAYGQTSWPNSQLHTVSGTNTYSVTPVPAATLTKGFTLRVKFTNSNSGASTLNVSTLGDVPLTMSDGTALVGGEIKANDIKIVIYDQSANKWTMVGGSGGGGSNISFGAPFEIPVTNSSSDDFQYGGLKYESEILSVGSGNSKIESEDVDLNKGSVEFNTSGIDVGTVIKYHDEASNADGIIRINNGELDVNVGGYSVITATTNSTNIGSLEFNPTGTKLDLGSDLSQDLYKRNSSGYLERIPVGSNGQVLGVNAGVVEYINQSGGVTAVNGTTNRITSTGGSTPTIDISSTFESLLGKVASPLSQFASTTSAQLRGVLSDELGTGAALFNGATPTSFGLTNATGLPVSTGISGLGTGVATALGVNTGSAGSFIVNAGSNGVLNANTNDIYYPSTTQSGTTYTVLLSDNHSTIRFTNSSPITVTLPNGLPTNFDVILKKMGTGNITITATGTLTAPANTIQVQYTGAFFNHVGSNVWEGVGSLGASSLNINVGVTTIANGTSGRIPYNNSGIYGELPVTGSGNVVLSTSPTLVTPALGTPTTINLTNGTGLPLTTGVTGIAPPANGGTGVNNGSNTITTNKAITFNGTGTFHTFTTTGNTSVTFPTIGTLATQAGTETFTNKTLTSPLINFGSDANGDIMVRQSGAYARLPIGSTNQTIRVVSGAVSWANPMVYSLFDDYTDVSNTSTTETDLYSHTIGSNTLIANGNKLEVVFSGSFVTTSSNALSVGNKVAVYFAGTKIFDPGSGSSVSNEGGWRITGTLIRSSSSVMRCTLVYTTEGTLVTKTVDVSSVDFTNTNILKITGQGAASSFITAKIGNITFNQ